MSKKVYLSPSTQQDNIGVGDYGTEEKRMNQVCDIVEKELKRHGIITYRNKPWMSLSEVVADSNNKDPDVHFAIHSNANDGLSRGCEAFCYKLNNEPGHTLAKKIYNRLAPITPTSDRGVKQGYNFYGPGRHMYELVYTKNPAALVEIAFHDNTADAKWIVGNITNIGVALTKGLLDFFNVIYDQDDPYSDSAIMRYGYINEWFQAKDYKENDSVTWNKLIWVLRNFDSNYLANKYQKK